MGNSMIARMERALDHLFVEKSDIADVIAAMRKVSKQGAPIKAAIGRLNDFELGAVAAVIADIQYRMLQSVKRENS